MNKQELIDELSKYVERYEDATDEYYQGRHGAYKVSLKLAKQLDEPQKPVVPKFVAEWFEENKEDLSDNLFAEIGEAWELIGNHEDYKPAFLEWLNTTSDCMEIVLSMRNGYEVKKESLYYVILSENTGGWKYTFLDEDGSINRTNNKAHIQTFTEKKVKAIDERYWAFANKVDEGVE